MPSHPAVAASSVPTTVSQLPPETKAAMVMRLLQGEPLAAVAASSGVSAVTLELWRTEFLAGAIARLGASPAS
jgi:transposase-like protein